MCSKFGVYPGPSGRHDARALAVPGRPGDGAFLLAVCAAALVILLLPGPRESLRQRLVGAGALCGAAACAAAAFLVIRATGGAVSAEPSPLDAAQTVSAFDPAWLTDDVGAFLGPWGRTGTAVFGLSALVALVVLGTLLATALGGVEDGGRTAVARAVAVALVAGPSLLVVLNYLVADVYFAIQERYGFSLLPGAVAVAASSWHRQAQALVAAVALPYAVLSAAAWSSPVPGA